MRLIGLTATVISLALSIAVVASEPTLKDLFGKYFRVGAAISSDQAVGNESRALELVAKQFNTITPENLLKWQDVHPQSEQFNFDPADRFVQFGEKNRMFIVGHNLVWHNQTPAWVFESKSGKSLDRDVLLERMRSHIHSVVGRYKGRINGWDVVNEAIADDGSMRNSKWQQIIGDDYLQMAFRYAHEADPNAELYYNDYNEWQPQKRRAIKTLVQNLRSKRIRIDGIGLQGHWGLDYPSATELEAMFNDYGSLGVKLMITELDITVLPDPASVRGADITRKLSMQNEFDSYRNGLPDSLQRRLADRYAEIFRIFVKHANKLARVTFWGVHDGQSWRNNWPVRGRTDYPLLFDRRLNPKPAYTAVVSVANGK